MSSHATRRRRKQNTVSLSLEVATLGDQRLMLPEVVSWAGSLANPPTIKQESTSVGINQRPVVSIWST
eukprot:11222111-Lingulodinium_polyedra.AAC.1